MSLYQVPDSVPDVCGEGRGLHLGLGSLEDPLRSGAEGTVTWWPLYDLLITLVKLQLVQPSSV